MLIQLLLAIALPAFVIWKSDKPHPVKYPYIYSVGSFACCAWGLIAELKKIRTLLFAGRIGSIEDTIDAIIPIAIMMAVITVIINLLSLAITFERPLNQDNPQ